VRERARRHDHAVAVGSQARQLVGQVAGDALDAADLAARRGAGVDSDLPTLIGSGAFRQSEGGIG
jgi:hypothetical protein